jgi:nitrogen fixation-related uncharacterized protein
LSNSSIVIGFLIGWLFARALGSEAYDMDYDELSIREDEHNREVKELELKYENEKKLLKAQEKKNRELKSELMKKITLLQEKELELKEFETVLVKAEETIERLKQSIN